jgi:pyrroline-5-carboxylate reductase
MTKTIGFIGAGNMGGAIIRGLLSEESRQNSDVIVCDPRENILEELSSAYPGIQTSTDNAPAAGASILILAVKPQVYEAVIFGIRDNMAPDTIVVTIAAGLAVEKVSGWFRDKRKIIRTMPNTPALISEGMTALSPGPDITDEELQSVQSIFKSVGRTVVMPEHLMNAYTSLAGSSPAWVFMFIEALADGAVKEGIPRNQAYEIASQAVMGSARLVAETGSHPGVLKDQVCSPGGTTIEAVATLEAAGFRSAVIQAVSDCTAKAGELGSK